MEKIPATFWMDWAGSRLMKSTVAESTLGVAMTEPSAMLRMISEITEGFLSRETTLGTSSGCPAKTGGWSR